jgi:hypothetical protein
LFREELYDLIFDPVESCNLASYPEFKETLVKMRYHLDGWMQKTGDPILSGSIPLPPEAFVSEPNDKSYLDIWKRVKRPEGYG